ncbi:MAG: hypothetical protein J6D47_10910 [Peptostreptococcaceae bacterium]|nr:hypothetical protein [Peptostreptococcaceae bacterium]MBP3930059.1 hypothetical protein [Peptostreptococcaceae bacterium]
MKDVYVAATILKPNGSLISRKKSTVVDNTIIFTIDKSFTDEVDEIGTYKIQFHLYDEDDNRITLPPISFEVKELLGVIDETAMNHDIGIVDESSSDFCNVIDDEMELRSNGRYIRTIWKSGDLISSPRLNKIEEAIEYLDGRLSTFITDDDLINVEAIQYDNENHDNIRTVKDALDKLLYVELSISLTSNTSTVLEKGRLVNGVIINWTYSKRITSQLLDGVPIDLNTRSYLYNSTLTSDKRFTLTASDVSKTFSKDISFNFYNGVYWGTSSNTTYNDTFIMSLSKELRSNRNKTFSVSCGEGQYIYYCIPTNYGTPTFTVGGFTGGFNKVSTIQFKNAYGYTESYDIYKSTNSNLGNTTVVVS